MLTVASAGQVVTVTLNRPAARNAIDLELAGRLDEAISEADADPDVRIIILAADGSVFCAGQDLKALAAGEEEAFVGDHGWAGFTARRRQTPVIAAVQGPAVGGGFELVLAADLVVASTEAYFALPEVKHGLLAAAGGAARLPHRLPRNLSLELLMTGARLSAQRAFEFGIVNRLVETEKVLDAANSLARDILSNPAAAVAASLAVAERSIEQGSAAADLLASTLLTQLRSSADSISRVAGFSLK